MSFGLSHLDFGTKILQTGQRSLKEVQIYQEIISK